MSTQAHHAVNFTKEQLQDAPADRIDALTKGTAAYRNRTYEYYRRRGPVTKLVRCITFAAQTILRLQMPGGTHSMAKFHFARHVKIAEPPQGELFLQS